MQDARKKGEVGQSQDVPKLLISVALLEMIIALSESGMSKLQALMQLPLSRISDAFGHAADEVFSAALTLLGTFCLLTISLALLMRIVGGWIQYGPLFAVDALQLDVNRLNPVNQIKQMFSMRKLTDMLTNLLKAATIGLVFWLVVVPQLEWLVELAYGDLNGFWKGVEAVFKSVARTTLGALLALGYLDFGLQKYYFLKQQRMSHEDIRNEYKNSEGDPHMKGHRKALAQEILNEPASPRKARVEEADLLLVNPTHYAVALFYRPGKTPLPRILLKGEDFQAKALIARAHQAGVPVIRFIWLTRTLYRMPEGHYIPRDTLQPVAQVYRVLRQLDRSLPAQEIIELE
ncbi:Type III secretion inner membrane protein (YscU,SpaS,EscU,HrcU,SsaU, homologous to flagellar export components) [Dickeya aquatica]|uniref:Type III secretion inner membrane protein (YscU,SpaS,EscU,HrcU,SsaU, homologous to flagellar export components) n=1 Tax=Dickeya aquatica TaxID=1401087 RepID=A0A375AAZ6_9GAMM|nr:Type III secretion inner membrane protein (YscU,SpaS,EscU,HrcU,SsaU, homologous to flagellar export components) [Dickeya aquatica]